MHQSIVISLIT